jgi:hypothetical protein
VHRNQETLADELVQLQVVHMTRHPYLRGMDNQERLVAVAVHPGDAGLRACHY